MRRVAANHFQIGILIGILKTELKAKPVRQRQAIVHGITAAGIRIRAIFSFNDVPAVGRHAQADIVRAGFNAAFQQLPQQTRALVIGLERDIVYEQ